MMKYRSVYIPYDCMMKGISIGLYIYLMTA